MMKRKNDRSNLEPRGNTEIFKVTKARKVAINNSLEADIIFELTMKPRNSLKLINIFGVLIELMKMMEK